MSTPSRLDLIFGRVFWGIQTIGLAIVSGFCFWAGLTGTGDLQGGERWGVLALTFSAGVLFALLAWAANRKRRLSEIVDDA